MRLVVHLLLISKLVFVFKKKPAVGKYAGKLRPLAPCGRDEIQIVDFFGGGTSKKVGVRLAAHLLLISKLVFVLKKKPAVGKYAGKLRPFAPCGRDGIQIVDFCAGQCK